MARPVGKSGGKHGPSLTNLIPVGKSGQAKMRNGGQGGGSIEEGQGGLEGE